MHLSPTGQRRGSQAIGGGLPVRINQNIEPAR